MTIKEVTDNCSYIELEGIKGFMQPISIPRDYSLVFEELEFGNDVDNKGKAGQEKTVFFSCMRVNDIGNGLEFIEFVVLVSFLFGFQFLVNNVL